MDWIKRTAMFSLIVSGFCVHAQKTEQLSLHDAIDLALKNSNEVNLARAKVTTKKFETVVVKDNRYPDLKINGQYLRLANAKINLKSTKETTTNTDAADEKKSPKVNQLAFGQASLIMPIFSGFKLKNSIAASEATYQAEIANAAQSQEETAIKVVRFYADLYKAQKSVELYEESLKSGQQRVTDFQAMEQNGLLARNDLLKSQLQVSRFQLSLEEARKNVKIINLYLNILLKRDGETTIVVTPESVDAGLLDYPTKTADEAVSSRYDNLAVESYKNAARSNIKVAKSGYYPSLAFSAGYVALDLQNVVTVQNAMNVGLGFSYNLSSLFKTGKEVSVAKSRLAELDQQQAMLSDKIKIEIEQAKEEYSLSQKQDGVYTEAVAQADENYRIVKDKYDNGISDTNDLLEADVDDLSAKINLAYAKANKILRYYELLNATGQLTESFNLSQKN